MKNPEIDERLLHFAKSIGNEKMKNPEIDERLLQKIKIHWKCKIQWIFNFFERSKRTQKEVKKHTE